MIDLPENTNDAIRKLDELLVVPPQAIYFFIFGQSRAINCFASLAEQEKEGMLREVVRRSQFSDIAKLFVNLEKDPDLPELNPNKVIGFSTSGRLIISDVITSSDTLNIARAVQAFVYAEGGQK